MDVDGDKSPSCLVLSVFYVLEVVLAQFTAFCPDLHFENENADSVPARGHLAIKYHSQFRCPRCLGTSRHWVLGQAHWVLGQAQDARTR